jgi:hypothetical protein
MKHPPTQKQNSYLPTMLGSEVGHFDVQWKIDKENWNIIQGHTVKNDM